MRRKPLFPPPPDATGQPPRHKGRQSFSVLTINGRVRLERIRWHSPGEGTSSPVDRWLDAAEASFSQGVRELCCRLNAHGHSFGKAAANLARAAQLQLSGETLRQLVEQEGRKALAAQKSGALAPGWSARDCTVTDLPASAPSAPAPKSRVYFGCDGVMAPLVTAAEKRKRRTAVKAKRQKRGKKAKPLPAAKPGADQAYKEFKLVVYYDDQRRHRLVEGTKGDHQAAGQLMRRQAARLRLDQADEKIGIVDGAPWIRKQTARQNLPLDALGLDFYHLAEHVHAARRAVFGDDSEPGKTWVGEILHAFKHEGYDPTWTRLLDWRGTLRGAKRKAADALLNYVGERKEMILYPQFAAKGWQLGSGPTESCCKTLTARLKGAGMRWDAGNAEAVMALDALDQSGQWQAYWLTQA